MRGADSVFYPMLFQPRKGGDVEIVHGRQVVDDLRALVKSGGGPRGEVQNPSTGWHSESCTRCRGRECWFGPGTGSLIAATHDAGGNNPGPRGRTAVLGTARLVEPEE